MKLKYYLRGMGVGIIVTTVILVIVFSLHKDETLSDDEIRARARALGMVTADENTVSEKLSDTPEDDVTDVPQESEAADAKTEPDTGKEEQTDAKSQQEIADTTTDGQADGSADTDTETVEQVELSIVGGEYSDDVCKKLKRAGVIKDADDFNKYLSEGGYDSLIQPGTYVIPKDADYDTIIRLITEKKETETKDNGKKTQKNKKKS